MGIMSRLFWRKGQQHQQVGKLPSMKPTVSFPYLASLTVSPDEETVSCVSGWVPGGRPGAFTVVIVAASSGSELITFKHDPRKLSNYDPPDHVDFPHCLFVGNYWVHSLFVPRRVRHG